MRLLVTGDRKWDDALTIKYELQEFTDKHGYGMNHTLVHGDARGADTYAEVVAQFLGFTIERHPAEWKKYGSAAGPKRNKEMLDSGVDYWIAFHNDLESSKGTKNMVKLLQKAGIPGHVVGGE